MLQVLLQLTFRLAIVYLSMRSFDGKIWKCDSFKNFRFQVLLIVIVGNYDGNIFHKKRRNIRNFSLLFLFSPQCSISHWSFVIIHRRCVRYKSHELTRSWLVSLAEPWEKIINKYAEPISCRNENSISHLIQLLHTICVFKV